MIVRDWQLTVNVGSSGLEVADSTSEEPLAEASLATLDAEELASLRTDCASAWTEPASRAVERTAAAAEKRMM